MNYYGQFGDDKLIESYFDKDYIGGCIEIGAADGIHISNTKHFEELGWYCLCVEPNPRYYNELKINRFHTVNYAISSIENSNSLFNIVDLGGGFQEALSALYLDPRMVKKHQDIGYNINPNIINVKTITLDNCIKQYYDYNVIDFISIDTEGTELDVLQSFSIEKWNPKLIIVENNFNDTIIENYLLNFGYKKDKTLEINDYYIKK